MTTKIDCVVGANLRALRQERGLSESQCAASLRLDIAEYRHLEAGARRLTAGQLMTLAEMLRVPLAHFYTNSAPEGLQAAVVRGEAAGKAARKG